MEKQRFEIKCWALFNKIDSVNVSQNEANAKGEIKEIIEKDVRNIYNIIDKDRNIIFDTQKLKQMGLRVLTNRY